jgi:hypothetical protein
MLTQVPQEGASHVVKFIDVDPDQIPNMRDAHRGRVSYPILKSFLETGKTAVQLDRTGMQQSLVSLNSSLGAYIRSHELPIKLFTRGGEIYLIRTDLDAEGNVVPVSPNGGRGVTGEVKDITPDEVSERFDQEKDKTTK